MTQSFGLEALIKLIEKLKGREDYYGDERKTRTRLINPIIGALGWNVGVGGQDETSPEEVEEEFSVTTSSNGTKKVDYCIRTQTQPLEMIAGHKEKYKNRVLIEAKQAGKLKEKLEDAEKQSLEYALYLGTPLAVITDGIEWMFYLPIVGQSFEGRRCYSVDIFSQEPSEAADTLNRFLSREYVVTGKAQEEAEKELKNLQSERGAHKLLKEAWEQALKGPDSRMVEILTEKVDEIYGNDLFSMETIIKFLRRRAGVTKEEIAWKSGVEINEQDPEQIGKDNTRTRKPSIRPVAFLLDDVRHELAKSKWNEVLIRLCEILNKEPGSIFEERVSEVRGRKRLYFSKSKAELKNPLPIPGSRFYIEGATLNSLMVEQLARKVLVAVRGSDDGFHIETEDAPEES